jgi:hypothetical protein
MRDQRFLRYCFLVCLVLVSGCASKVNPWERGNLARPQMSLEPYALDAALMKHAYSSKEASSGGYGVGGGGCGCN